jgi:hypothetical protein
VQSVAQFAQGAQDEKYLGNGDRAFETPAVMLSLNEEESTPIWISVSRRVAIRMGLWSAAVRHHVLKCRRAPLMPG